MIRSYEFRQGFDHAARMFSGSLLDPEGAQVIVENLQLTLESHPPEYARGIGEALRRVREELARS